MLRLPRRCSPASLYARAVLRSHSRRKPALYAIVSIQPPCLMIDDLRALHNDERNRHDQAPIITWMFRGVEDRVRVPQQFVRHFANSQRLLVPASEVGIPDELQEAVYVERAGHLCFTVPGYAHTVFSQQILNPEEDPEPHEALLILKAACPPSNPASFPKVEMDAEVVALCASHDCLFVLTRDRGRIPEARALRLHRLRPDPTHGVSGPHMREAWPLEFDGRRAPLGQVRVAVSVLPTGESFFLATHDGSAFSAPLHPGRALALEPLPDPAWPSDGGLPALYAPPMAKALETDTVLVVVDGNREELHRVRGVDGVLAAEPLADKDDCLPRVAFVDGWTYNVHQQVPAAQPRDLLISLLVAASPVTGQLWTLALDDHRTALPLVGGGQKPFYPGAVPGNLLDLNIGPVNRVVVVPHAGLLFGTSGIRNWLFLLSPAMLGLLDPAANPLPPVPAPTGRSIIS